MVDEYSLSKEDFKKGIEVHGERPQHGLNKSHKNGGDVETGVLRLHEQGFRDVRLHKQAEAQKDRVERHCFDM